MKWYHMCRPQAQEVSGSQEADLPDFRILLRGFHRRIPRGLRKFYAIMHLPEDDPNAFALLLWRRQSRKDLWNHVIREVVIVVTFISTETERVAHDSFI
jgi:hypothetical protein